MLAELADLVARQRALLDVVRRGADAPAPRVARGWQEVEAAAARLETALGGGGPLSSEAESELARARALAGLLAAELERRRSAVIGELARVRTARRRLADLRPTADSSGGRCDVQG